MRKLFTFLSVVLIFAVLCSCGQSEKALDKSCTLNIKCDTVLKNIDKLAAEKRDIVPEDGVILADDSAEFAEGESLFDIFKRELKAKNIHIDFEASSSLGTAYVKGIANLYSGDCGEFSGWMIRVNGEDLTVGCSDYYPKNGDMIEWLYTCDMGNDL